MRLASRWERLIDFIIKVLDKIFNDGVAPPPVPPPEPPPPEPPPEPEPPPTPDPHPDGSKYVHMSRVADIQLWIKQNSRIWEGVYDLNYVLGKCRWAFPTYFSESEMRQTAQAYSNILREGEALSKRLPKRHPDFPKRSKVRKSVWRDFEQRLRALNAIVGDEGYRGLVQTWPGAGVYYDSLQGWCQYCNERGIRTPD